MKNEEVASLLYEIADILEIQDVKFKPQAYRKAAQNIESLGESIEDVHKKGKLRDIQGVGEAIAKKVGEFIDTGTLKYIEDLKKEVPEGLLTLLEIPGLGPKKVSLLYKELGISSIEELKSACENHDLEGIKGLGAKTEENILRGIELLESSMGRFLLNQALDDGEAMKKHLKALKNVKKIELAGSLRRRKDTVGDIDILVSSDKAVEVMDRFVSYGDVVEVVQKGDTKSSIRLGDGMQVDIRVVPEESFGAAMQYFTGSKEHNVKVRKVAISKGLKINEYGVFKKDSDEKIAGSDEKKVYKALGLEYIPPELREDRGEVELAQKGKVPKLLELKDIKGDLHVHTEWSDGISSINEMVSASKKLGYSYFAVCDHSESLKIARGLSKDRLLKQVREIRKLNNDLKDFQVLSSIECNIKPNGTLDIQPGLEKEIDFITGAIHSSFNMDEKDMTKRIITAMENEKVKILAHPTGRLLQRREAYKVNLDKLMDSAKENDVIFEINAFPDRLDLNDANIKYAKENEMRFAISTDSHNTLHLEYMRFGVSTARRGWLEKKDVINTQPLNKINKILTL
ncbi:MAG: DNA polymerase/3'-5' exonuclease PolX [Thermoplasmata archaeon]|nr:MAG: DNA polymerase/3'-5' exonuclease PolX [Thermoplasmata archaeon]